MSLVKSGRRANFTALRDVGKKWWLILFSPILFVILTTSSMFVYPGGTLLDSRVNSHSFFRNFFSDLGRINVFDGESNLLSLIFFLPALIYLSSAVIVLEYLFFTRLAKRYEDNPLKFKICRYSTIFGMFSGINFLGVGLTPADVFPILHFIFSVCAFFSAAICSLLISIVFVQEQSKVKIAGILGLCISVVLVAFLFILVVIPPIETDVELLVSAIGQKITVYLILAEVTLQSIVGMYLLGGFNSRNK